MKFSKITDDKIQITLSTEDLKKHNISIKSLFFDPYASEELLQNILDNAVSEIGFDTGDQKLLVEAIINSEEECVFTITKLPFETTNIQKSYSPLIFRFDNFDDFINLCTYMKNIYNLNLKTISSTFSLIQYNNSYYLCCADFSKFYIFLDNIYNIFSEFGENINNSTQMNGILNEYGHIIFKKNAILKALKTN